MASALSPPFPSSLSRSYRRTPSSARPSFSPSTFRIAAQASAKISNPDDLAHKDYYEILGVSVDASYEEIRKAYRNLQKIHHPDVAGPEGHAMTLLLNEAYKTLTSNELRRAYTSSTANSRGSSKYSYTGFPYSAWNGPDRPQGIFVDENACIGCRECVFHAHKTFSMDESGGCARVTNQWGDSDAQINVALQACPVNCIHYVDREDLPVLEYLMRPQPKESNGVFGGGWERPTNVFMAARTFKRKMEATSNLNNAANVREETPAQRKARMDAEFRMRAGPFSWIWSWGIDQQFKSTTTRKKSNNKDSTSWYGLFGRSSTSELLKLEIESDEASQVIQNAQEWAMTFASSSELPLPLPFKADLLSNGVHLTLIAADMGVLQAKGSLAVTVENDEDGATFLVVKREGVTGTSALPGERTIIGHLKEAVQGQDNSYDFYRVPRRTN